MGDQGDRRTEANRRAAGRERDGDISWLPVLLGIVVALGAIGAIFLLAYQKAGGF